MTTDASPTKADEKTDAAPAADDAVEQAARPLSWKDLLMGVATQSWLASMVFHMVLMIVLALVLGTIHVASTIGQAPEFDASQQDNSPLPEITHFEVGYTPLAPSELSTDTLMLTEAPSV